MNPQHAYSARRQIRNVTILAGTMLLVACAHGVPRSAHTLGPVDHETLKRTSDSVIEESRKLAERQDALLEQLQQETGTRAEISPAPPAYDPLENSVISISMHDASVGELLWALADELNVNLIVDPAVVRRDRKTSLQLHDVTAREVYNHILEAFDLHGELRGGALVVSEMEERVFNVEMLNATTSLDLSTGGDVFGAGLQSGGGGSGQSLRGTLTMEGSVGKQVDPYKQLEATIGVILAEDQGARASGAKDSPEAARFTLDPMTGTLFVRARPSQVRAVENVVDALTKALRKQVLVEAQILDVSLNDDSQFGVDWTVLRERVAAIYGDNPATIPSFQKNYPAPNGQNGTLDPRTIIFPDQTLGTAVGRGLGLSYVGSTFAAALNVLRSFGNVRVVSNPSVRVRSGSPAYLSVGSNIRYVTKSTTSFSNAGGGGFNTSSDVQTDSLFSGIVIGVAPLVMDNGTIELLVHPMQTEVEPGSLELQQFPNGNAVTLPVVNVKGITTTLSLKDGDMVMLGGLIDQNASMVDRGIPGLSDVPAFGRLFGSRGKAQTTRELVIVLRVRVL